MKKVDGTLVYVCLECWHTYAYWPYFTETAEQVERMTSGPSTDTQ